MPQIFHRSANTLAKVSLVAAVILIGGFFLVLAGVIRAPYLTEAGVARQQPVPFSHKHHVAGLGIDCRYCHSSVETSSFAGLPSTKTCMNCHSQVWADSPALEPVRQSYRENRPIQWTRVNDLPDFVYFDHSIHVKKGVGCVTCHGQVDEMPLTWQAHAWFMDTCLECHRRPERYIRPREQVFEMRAPAFDQIAMGRELLRKYHVDSARKLTNCSICHR